MTTKVIVKGPKPNAGRILVQQVDPTQPNKAVEASPVEVPEDEEREFWIHQTNALLITEMPNASGSGPAPVVSSKKR